MVQVRNAAVAGQFYPVESAQLAQDVDALLSGEATDSPCPKAIIAPHAGYVYSGAVAASAYARVRNGARQIKRVVLLGPAHRVGFRGIASSSAAFFASPLGQVPLDRDCIARLQTLPGVHCRDDAHAREHSLEVHLPFLQRALDDFTLVPLVVGQSEPDQVAAVIDAAWGGPETLIVVSSDLSHFLPYQQAIERDLDTCRLIEGRATDLNGEQACGCKALNGLMSVLRRRKLGVERLCVLNSGDTAGNRERVVGYGSWAVDETMTADDGALARCQPLSLVQRQQLLHLARQVIEAGLAGPAEVKLQLDRFHPALQAQRGSFVTLNLEGRLRGCIGSLSAHQPLVTDVATNAASAAFRDKRFKPLSAGEYPHIDLHISVLTAPEPLAVTDRSALLDALRPGIDGLVLQVGSKRSTYLPSVWEKIPSAQHFVAELRAKAGLPREGWEPGIRLWTYQTEEFS